jgi:malate permease and related proteins
LIAAGYYLTRISIITDKGVKEMTRLLFGIVTPCIIITSLQLDYSTERAHHLLVAFIAFVSIHLFSVVFGEIFFNKRLVADAGQSRVARFSTVYSNAGFMGLPVLDALLGQEGLFIGSVYIAVFNIFTWTHGVIVYSGKVDKKSLIKALVNPNIVAIVVGMLFFYFAVKIIAPVEDGMIFLSQLNTPLSMIIIGNRIAQINLKSLFSGLVLWPAIFVRNIVMPVILLFSMRWFGVSGVLLLACIIPVACPTAGNTVLIAELYGADSIFASRLMALSTLFSIVTIPAVVFIAFGPG